VSPSSDDLPARSLTQDQVRAIWTAVLQRAVDDYRQGAARPDSEAARWHQDAAEWIFLPRNESNFEQVCELLNLDPDAVRDGLRRKYGPPSL